MARFVLPEKKLQTLIYLSEIRGQVGASASFNGNHIRQSDD